MSLLPLAIFAAAQLASRADASQTVVRCDAAAGKLQRIVLSGTSRIVSARVHALHQAPGLWLPGYIAPSAGLLFILPGKSIAGVQVYVNLDEPDKLKVTLHQPGYTGGQINFASAPIDATILISARLEGGRLTASADGLHETARVNDKAVLGAELICSSGAFEFTLLNGIQPQSAPSRQSEKLSNGDTR